MGTSLVVMSVTTWIHSLRRMRRNTRSTSPSTLPLALTPRTSRRCTPRPMLLFAPTQHQRPRLRRPSRRSDGTVHASQLLKERIASPRSKPLSSVPNRPRNKCVSLWSLYPCCIISVRLFVLSRYKNVGLFHFVASVLARGL